ncbi:MAG: hypothetical protein AMXMBFR33_57930 [Candidatus Xenobia bacterium]
MSWTDVTPAAPCVNCGSTKWCSRSEDAAICMKAPWPEGKERTDKDGATYWITFANERPRERPEPAEKPRKETAPPQVLDRVYRRLLEELGLAQEHRDWLLARGHSPEGIERREYRTMPRERAQAARKLIEAFGEHVCAQVPGLYLATGKDSKFWSLAGAQGILIPCRDAAGRIVALKVRSNQAGPNRYTYVSSKKYEGASPGRQAHVPLGTQLGPDRALRVTEGELKADLATELSGTLTISVPGVDAWQQALPLLTELGCTRVLLAFDADFRSNPKVLRNLLDAANAYGEHCQVMIETWEGQKGIDELLHAEGRPETVSVADFEGMLRAPANLPRVLVNNRPVQDVARDALDALRRGPSAGRLFCSNRRIVRVEEDDGRPGYCFVRHLDAAGLSSEIATAMVPLTKGKKGIEIVPPPRWLTEHILARPSSEWGLPRLVQVSGVPVAVPPGRILDRPGYDDGTGIYYHPDPGLNLAPIPANPTDEELAAAIAVIEDIFEDFPWTPGSRTAALGAIAVPFVRPMIKGPLPLHYINAPGPGAGKTLLAEILIIVPTGYERAGNLTAFKPNSEEMTKQLLGTLAECHAVNLCDNQEHPIDHPVLAAMLTSWPTYTDRKLGVSENLTVPNLGLWLFTGNNVAIAPDIRRRTVPICIDPEMEHPEERTGFRHPQLKLHVKSTRGQIVHAVLTWIAAWLSRGRPGSRLAPLGGFEEWSQVVGGLLELIERNDFLATRFRLGSQDPSTDELIAFLHAWKERFDSDPVTANALFGLVDGKRVTLSSLSEKNPTASLGRLLGKQAGRVLDGLRIVAAGKDNHLKLNLFRLEEVRGVAPQKPETPAEPPQRKTA